MPLGQNLVLVNTAVLTGSNQPVYWLEKTDKIVGDLREMVYIAASCSYMLKISKTHFFLGHPVLHICCNFH